MGATIPEGSTGRMGSEQKARETIDRLLTQAGWTVTDVSSADVHASRGVAIREFPLHVTRSPAANAVEGKGAEVASGRSAPQYADYLLYIDGKAAGVIEAKKVGATLTGVEIQSARYAKGLPGTLPAWRRPLPFIYESIGLETQFTNGLHSGFGQAAARDRLIAGDLGAPDVTDETS